MLPKDPIILLSYINLKLRDRYGSLDDLCEDLNVDKREIEKALLSVGYEYDATQNQFK